MCQKLIEQQWLDDGARGQPRKEKIRLLFNSGLGTSFKYWESSPACHGLGLLEGDIIFVGMTVGLWLIIVVP